MFVSDQGPGNSGAISGAPSDGGAGTPRNADQSRKIEHRKNRERQKSHHRGELHRSFLTRTLHA